MGHWVIAYRRVDGSPTALRRRLRTGIVELLRTALPDGDEPAPDGSLVLRLPARVLGRDAHKQVRMRVGVAFEHGPRTCIPLQWEAEPARHAFPVFRGTIEFEPLSDRVAQLAVVGAVTPPLGPIGALADAALLRQVAERTAQELADRLAHALAAAATPDADVDEPADPARLRVRDVMAGDPLVLDADMPLRTAALLLFHFDVAGAPVRDADGGLVGVLSESDLVAVETPPRYGLGGRAARGTAIRRARTVGQACTRPAAVVRPGAALADAAGMLWDDDIGRLVVVDGAEILGVVSRHDVLRAVIRNDSETQAAVERVLRDRDDTAEVIAAVEWGVATITGTVDDHSSADALVGALRAVDGVVRVESRLEWRHDDLVPPMIP